MLEIRNLTVSYQGKSVLQNLSAHFRAGALTSIVGVNGAGKSTLLKAILGLAPTKEGEAYVEGESLFLMKRRLLAQKISYLSQMRSVADMTVQQLVLNGRYPHLSYPRRYTEHDREIVRISMEKAEIAHLADQPLAHLSGGMRQSAYLAMALAQDTDYILLDEPTSFLDVAHRLSLMKLLRSLADQGKGILCVMHDLPLAFSFSDEIALLDGGKILCQAPPEVLAEGSAIQSVFGVSLKRLSDGGYCYQYSVLQENSRTNSKKMN